MQSSLSAFTSGIVVAVVIIVVDVVVVDMVER